jgi:hypothetical protein
VPRAMSAMAPIATELTHRGELTRRATSRHMQRSKIHAYSITSSAMASSDGGTSMPRALAVLRLIARTWSAPAPAGRPASSLSKSCRHSRQHVGTGPRNWAHRRAVHPRRRDTGTGKPQAIDTGPLARRLARDGRTRAHSAIRLSVASPIRYSITSSARASSVGGTSMPSVLAVMRLITSSNLVGS